MKRKAASKRASPYVAGLDRRPANYVPLTPLSFLARSAEVYPHKPAVIHGNRSFTYPELAARCRRLASALARRGIGPGDTVAIMAPNVPAMLEAHFGVPMAGAVLNALNYRLDARTIAFLLEHSEAKVLITDREFAGQVGPALAMLKKRPLVIDVDDELYTGPGERLGKIEYEAFIAAGDPDFAWTMPSDEWDAISLNYTSGTTGNPKGVVYHHRGAALMCYSNMAATGMGQHPVYLWTLPMFHCNGWCFPWSVVAMGGTHVCLRKVDPALIFAMIVEHGVTHMCGAPTVLIAVHVFAIGSYRAPVDVTPAGSTAVLTSPPHTIISVPVHTAVWLVRASGAPAAAVASQSAHAGDTGCVTSPVTGSHTSSVHSPRRRAEGGAADRQPA